MNNAHVISYYERAADVFSKAGLYEDAMKFAALVILLNLEQSLGF